MKVEVKNYVKSAEDLQEIRENTDYENLSYPIDMVWVSFDGELNGLEARFTEHCRSIVTAEGESGWDKGAELSQRITTGYDKRGWIPKKSLEPQPDTPKYTKLSEIPFSKLEEIRDSIKPYHVEYPIEMVYVGSDGKLNGLEARYSSHERGIILTKGNTAWTVGDTVHLSMFDNFGGAFWIPKKSLTDLIEKPEYPRLMRGSKELGSWDGDVFLMFSETQGVKVQTAHVFDGVIEPVEPLELEDGWSEEYMVPFTGSITLSN